MSCLLPEMVVRVDQATQGQARARLNSGQYVIIVGKLAGSSLDAMRSLVTLLVTDDEEIKGQQCKEQQEGTLDSNNSQKISRQGMDQIFQSRFSKHLYSYLTISISEKLKRIQI